MNLSAINMYAYALHTRYLINIWRRDSEAASSRTSQAFGEEHWSAHRYCTPSVYKQLEYQG